MATPFAEKPLSLSSRLCAVSAPASSDRVLFQACFRVARAMVSRLSRSRAKRWPPPAERRVELRSVALVR